VPGAQRVRLVPEAVAAADLEEALRLTGSPGVDFGERVVLETTQQSPLPRGGEGAVSLTTSPDPNQVAVHVEAPDGGWLVLSDTWFPGWVVSIDGAVAVPYPADAAFRAVWVPPGSSTVVWRYQPVSFRVGVGLSLAGLITLVAVWVLWIVHRRRV
jgi:uncharacterized membrane protein YfhO